MKQSYQELTKEIIKEIKQLGDCEPQEYFWILKQEDPQRFERMWFDTNGHVPYSETLSEILFDLVLSGNYMRPWKYKELNRNFIRSLKIKHIIYGKRNSQRKNL